MLRKSINNHFVRQLYKLRQCSTTPNTTIIDPENKLSQSRDTWIVPKEPVKSQLDIGKLPPRTKISAETIAHLERLSLVDCANKESIETLEDAIAFADQISLVNTDGVEPLITVLEDRPLTLRKDIVETYPREEILVNAVLVEDEYFVAPPGNIPLEARENLLHDAKDTVSKTLCEENGILTKNSPTSFNIAPIGQILWENLREEWFKSVVVNNENSVFMCGDDFAAGVDYVRGLCSEKLPYGVAEVLKIVRKENSHNNSSSSGESEAFKVNEVVGDFRGYFPRETVLKCTMFVSPSVGQRFFQQWQRHRKIWWRKFSASPGIYNLSEIKTDDSGNQSVAISAEYPWGNQQIETINMSIADHQILTKAQLQARDNKKKVQPYFITSTISLHGMFLNAICDAYDDCDFQGENKEVLRFHRKIAPYKIAFSNSISAESKEELKQLATYLCLQLRNNHISSLFIPDCYRVPLETQCRHYDKLGVPFTVVLNEATLRNGIAHLRSRDTTLKEQVHVTDLPNYIELLFKNY